MRPRTAIAGITFGVVLMSGIGAASAAPYPPPATGEGKASPSRVKQGHCTNFSGDGFLPGSQVEIFDDATRYGNTTADNSGGFGSRVCFAGDARVGSHVLSARGLNNAVTPDDPAAREVTAEVTVVGVEQTSSAQDVDTNEAASTTALVSPFSVAVFGLLLLPLLSGVLLVLERRHSRRRRRRTA